MWDWLPWHPKEARLVCQHVRLDSEYTCETGYRNTLTKLVLCINAWDWIYIWNWNSHWIYLWDWFYSCIASTVTSVTNERCFPCNKRVRRVGCHLRMDVFAKIVCFHCRNTFRKMCQFPRKPKISFCSDNDLAYNRLIGGFMVPFGNMGKTSLKTSRTWMAPRALRGPSIEPPQMPMIELQAWQPNYVTEKNYTDRRGGGGRGRDRG